MNRKILFVVLILVSSLSLSMVNASTRIALVMGNGVYKSAPLKNPVNDARDMAVVLKESGFNVTLKINATKREMENAVRQFGKALRKSEVGLFYYAGHGMQLKGRNYLIPINALIESESDVAYESLDAGRVLGKMEDAGNNLNIVIFDACRNNPFARSFRSLNPGLASMDAPTGSIIAYATAPGKLASDGGGDGNGIYTKYLIQNMRKPGLTIEQVFKNVRVAVLSETNRKQTPWESSSLIGDFYFKREKISTTLSSEQAAPIQTPLNVSKKTPPMDMDTLLEMAETENNVARDGQYVKYKNNIIYDTNTNLEWTVGPDQDITWYKAEIWVFNLNQDNEGWRMPSIEELKGLYKKGNATYNRTSLLATTGLYVWSGRTMGTSGAWGFSFDVGSKFLRYHSNDTSARAFAVRSLNKQVETKKEDLFTEHPTKTASITPADKESQTVAWERQYVKYENDIVYDNRTDLEWLAGHDKDTNWNEAKSWVANLWVDGGRWRMPTLYELRALYKKNAGSRNMTPLLNTTGDYVWSYTKKDSSSAYYFSFIKGFENWGAFSNSYGGRAFAVRLKKEGDLSKNHNIPESSDQSRNLDTGTDKDQDVMEDLLDVAPFIIDIINILRWF